MIRWLHLSDFHVGKDEYGQRQIFKYILGEVSSKIVQRKGPDIIFITGDIANFGLKSEYEEFIDEFILPLMELLGHDWQGKIYVVPGNHDVNRKEAEAVSAYSIPSKTPGFFDPTLEAAAKRTFILPRFSAYLRSSLPDIGGSWLLSPEGAFVDSVVIKGHCIGIMGLNTAWLSESDEDKEKLTPGKAIVEAGLEALKECDIKIVLGHHPIGWFINAEGAQIRSLFGKAGVIYLHGHLHKNESHREEGAGYLFLSIQAGASFQAREHEVWINRLLWCELDFYAKGILIEPRQWSRENQEWAIDGFAFPERFRKSGTDTWLLPLPNDQSEMLPAVSGQSEHNQALILPGGWLLVSTQFLNQYRPELSNQEVIHFFDGRVPSWAEALSHKIPRRAIVRELVSILTASGQITDVRMLLLFGSGGEGKSTILRQVICDLIDLKSDWNILWHNNPDTILPVEFILEISRLPNKWLIVSDDADLIANGVFESTKTLRAEAMVNIHFLLSCRDTDWIAAGGNRLPWEQYSTVAQIRLRGLSLEDAELIVNAWNQCGSRGMGRLDGLDIQSAAERLVEEAKSEKYLEEGAFLGAMLRTRLGQDMKAHVTALLSRLDERSAPGGTLINAFAYIAASTPRTIISSRNKF